MEAPMLHVVPPTPHLSSNPYPTPLTGKSQKYPNSHEDEGFAPQRKSANGDASTSLDSSTTGASVSTGRSSSEKIVSNIYDMYGSTRESLSAAHVLNGAVNTPPNSAPDTGRESAMSGDYQTPLESPVDVDGAKLRGMTPTPTRNGRTSTPTPAGQMPGRTPTPTRQNSSPRTSNANGTENAGPCSPSGLQTDGQYIDTRTSPTIFINPPPRRSSRHSSHSAHSSHSHSQSQSHSHSQHNLPSQPRPSSSQHHSTSSQARPSLSPTPYSSGRISSEPPTSVTSSSSPSSLPIQPHLSTSIPSPFMSMAPRQAEGEDADSYYVRATYAALEVSGVRGDGYEDGEELTRARLGIARGVLPSPSPDTARRKELEMMGRMDLSESERKILQSLDRYGFFQPPGESRLVLLPNRPLTHKLALYRALSTVSPSPPQLPQIPSLQETPEFRAKEDKRISKWARMLTPSIRDSGGNVMKWGLDPRKGRKLEERVWKGIPDRWRAAAWGVLIEDMAEREGRERGEFLRSEMLAAQFQENIDLPSTFDIQIDLDVPRTISGHVMFKTRYGMGQRNMFHVLHAFSLWCQTCGYCQGMGPITAGLLCYLEPEKVYTSLIRLHDNYHMHEIFSPGFPGLLEAFYVQEKIMQRTLPGVYAVFKKNMISTTAYAVKWYITLFANTISFQTQLRLWDAYFLEGKDVLVLMAMAILWVFKDNLLSPKATFETILELLSSFYIVEDEDALLHWLHKAAGDKRLRRDMKTWRTEWKELVKTGKEKDVLL